ncbi:diguanylate cyclase [Paenibacillus ihuae]|uniref:diguanylate cyclase n=1 Tax=Paenibacillus ihuae TaxID=1232431 RepID=UPI0006D562D6|nr:diguanylate cyclase [Paenibacillus ihuae]
MITLDNYLILETISDNYTKSVYRCGDTISEETVILKVLKSEFTGPEAVMKFKQEYRLLKELSDHIEGVIKPRKLEEKNGYYIMVMEDIHGRSLKQIMEEKDPPDQAALVKLAIRIVDILGAVHEQNVIHKDIKPSNIIWNREQDIVRMIDFDLAVKLPKEKREFQNSGVLEGSIQYISPEQTGRMNRNIDYRSDYYSLGVVLYELMTGSRPFVQQEMLEQIYSIIAKEAIPPHQLTGGKVSYGLSGIIMKLMAKSSEERYRSAYGIKADLKKVLEGNTDFVTGAEDRLNIFRIPQKIYGRDQELTRLVHAFRHSVRGQSQLMLVTGEAGMGKTALVHELHKSISEEKGLFAEGKFDQYNRNTPYSAIIQAFRRLISQLLETPDKEYKQQIRQSLAQSLDGNGRLIAGLIPELDGWIGKQLEMEPLNPAEETNRFFITFAKFIEGITLNERPLVLFLDDLQWADFSSVKLVERLMLDPHLRRLFIVCSYRANEIHEGHPLFASIAKIETSRDVGVIALEPLAAHDVQSLIADTLYSPPERVNMLAEVIYKRTKGNSFFVSELLKELYRNGLLLFDERRGIWSWQLEQIQKLPVNDNVVEFLIMKLNSLPEEVRTILMLSAAIGNVFNIGMLKLISEEPQSFVTRVIAAAVEEELIVPEDSGYALFSGYLDEKDNEPMLQAAVSFRFAHDRIQQSFYQMIDADTMKELHLSIGRLMLKNLAPSEADEIIVDIAAHMNKGLELISDRAEMNEMIRLNLKAAHKAKAAFGYDSAYMLLETVLPQLPDNVWQNNDVPAAELYGLLAQCGYLTHHIAEADAACAVLLQYTTDKRARAQIYEMQANHYMYLGMMKESIASGRQGLQVMGMQIPRQVGMVSVLSELVKIKAALRGKTPEDIYTARQMEDPDILLIMRLLINFIPPAFISGETSLFGLIVLKQVGLTLKYGNSPESALAFIGYSMLLSGFGDVKGAFEFGRLGIRINDKFNDLQWRGAVHVLYTLFSHVWTEPWDTLHDWFTTSIEASLRTGNLLYLAHSCFYVNIWNPEMDLVTNLQESSRMIAMIENTKYKESLATAQLVRQYYRNLLGEIEDRSSLSDESFNEENMLHDLELAKYNSGIAIYYIYKMKLLFTYESYKEALVYIDKAYPIIGALSGSAFMEEFALYTFLNLVYSYPQLNASERRKAKARMRKELGRVRKWAKNAPDTFRQHEMLMKAEWARIFGPEDQAGYYYDLAIQASEHGKFVRYKALTNELASKFYNGKQFTEFAAYLLRQSVYYYSVWGAKAKIEFINERYPDLVRKINSKEFLYGRSVSEYSESIDLDSMIMASQAISKEIELDNLLEALMEIVIKNAGAQRGCIRMSVGSGLLVEGEYQPGESKISIAVYSQGRYDNLPDAILRQVEESGETLIYNDAFSETQFVNDPYIVRHRPKSVVCMPLINQNKTVAVIYLENNLVTGVFTKERMKIINLLSREMVFSLENASLYSELERSEEKYRELVNNLQDGIFITQDYICKYANEALAKMLGYEAKEMLEQPFENFLSPAECEKVMHYYDRRMESKPAPFEYETRLLHKDQVHEIIVIHKVTLINYMNKPAIQGTVKDITLRKQAEEELLRHKEHLEELVAERTKELELNNEELNKYIGLIEQISITDELTGLYNRRYFNKVFVEEVEKAAAGQKYLTYLMLDIDYFKKYNDTYGHYEGDSVLRRVGKLLHELAERADGFAIRLGGEEFGIIVSGFTPKQSRDYAEGIRRSIEDLQIPHAMSPQFGIITVSVGVAAVRVEHVREEDIYKLGDNALYQSKTEGRNRVTLFE